MTSVPRCPRCCQVMACYEGEMYCPDCLTFRPSESLPSRIAHRSPAQQARNDPAGYRRQMEATSGDQQ
jgi:hypothetical protein